MIELAEIAAPVDREALLLERRQEISDHAHDLQRTTRRELRKNLAAWSLGIAGGVWSFSTGDPIGLALSAIGFIPGFVSAGPEKSAPTPSAIPSSILQGINVKGLI